MAQKLSNEEMILQQLQDLATKINRVQDEVKENGNGKSRDNPNLDRTHVMKYLFDAENKEITSGDYLNFRGEVSGPKMNKLLLLLRTLGRECNLKLANHYADDQLSVSVSWGRKGRVEGVEFAKNINIQNVGVNPMMPSGDGELGKTGRKLW